MGIRENFLKSPFLVKFGLSWTSACLACARRVQP
jgi:hypothetical protein